MDAKQFVPYLELLKEPFRIYPAPEGADGTQSTHLGNSEARRPVIPSDARNLIPLPAGYARLLAAPISRSASDIRAPARPEPGPS